MITETGEEEEGGRRARTEPSKVPSRRAGEGEIQRRWVSSPPPPPLPLFSLRALSLGSSSPGPGWGWGPGAAAAGPLRAGEWLSPGGGRGGSRRPGLRHLCAHTPRTAPLRRLPGSDLRPLFPSLPFLLGSCP